jgi:hypothetical protein
VTITLNNVTDTAANSTTALSATLGVLVGDVNGDGAVLNGDVGLVKSQVNNPVSASNFREDVNADGSVLNGDVGITKGQVSTSLPAAQ